MHTADIYFEARNLARVIPPERGSLRFFSPGPGVLRRGIQSCRIAKARHSTGPGFALKIRRLHASVELERLSQLWIVDHRRRPLISH